MHLQTSLPHTAMLEVLVVPDGQGGAWVEVREVELGRAYVQPTTFVVFLLPFNLPGADIYPIFVRDDLARHDGAALGDGLQQHNFVLARTACTAPSDPDLTTHARRSLHISDSRAEGRKSPGMATEQVTDAPVELRMTADDWESSPRPSISWGP